MPRGSADIAESNLDQRGRVLLAGGGLLATALFWGSAVPVNAVLLRYLDPFVLTAGRLMLSVALLSGFVLWQERNQQGRTPFLPAGLGLRRFLTLGFFMGGFNALFAFSVLFSHPITIAAINVVMPLTGALVARVMLAARLERGFGTALALTILGGALVVYGQPGFDVATLGLRGGEVLIVVAMVSWNIYSVRAQQWLGHLSQGRLTLVSTVSACLWLGTIAGMLLALGIEHLPSLAPAQTPPLVVALFLYLALFPAAIGNTLWNHGVSVLGLPVSSLYVNLAPVFAVLVAIAFGFHPTWLQIAGGLVVMAGVFYMQLRKLRAMPHAAR